MNIALLIVPFLIPQFASLGLTQIKGRLRDIFGERVNVRLFYVNHDFYDYFGHELYYTICTGTKKTLLDEWVFRGEAFDNITPNHNEYFKRFYSRTSFSPDTLGKVMNLGTFIRQIIDKYNLASYDLVGINATFTLVPGLAFCRHLKQLNPGIITIMGGASLYREMGEAIIEHYPHLDYVCSGSGLISFPAFIEAALENDKKAMESINGILSAGNSGKVTKLSDDLDINHHIPLDYDDYFESFSSFDFPKINEPILAMETSRGCYWNKCTFCGLNEDQQKYRVKRTQSAIEEINDCIKRYNTSIEMVDNIMPRHYIKKVLPYLDVPEGKTILYEVRGDYTEEEMAALHQAKVTNIQPGIESLHTPIHELMNKGINAFQCISMLKRCVKYTIYPAWNLLIGFPGMTETMYEQLKTIIPTLKHIFPPGFLNTIRIDRYSHYWENKEKYGMKLHPFNAYEYIYPYGNEFLSKMAYIFEDRNYYSQRYLLLTKYITELDGLVNDWKKRWQLGKGNGIPKLTFTRKEDKTYIYDSREDPEKVNEYEVSALEEAILDTLETPLDMGSIISRFPGEGPGVLTGLVSGLDQKKLLFKEKNRYLSLVIREYNEKKLKALWHELIKTKTD